MSLGDTRSMGTPTRKTAPSAAAAADAAMKGDVKGTPATGVTLLSAPFRTPTKGSAPASGTAGSTPSLSGFGGSSYDSKSEAGAAGTAVVTAPSTPSRGGTIIDDTLIRTVLVPKQRCKFTTPELNTSLRLNYLKINRIQGLEVFKELRSLYLDNNGITKLAGVDSLIHLKALYLNSNFISTIEGLSALTNLEILSLADNQISVVDGLSSLKSLQTINLQNNRLVDASRLAECRALTSVDLSANLLVDVSVFDTLCALPELRLCSMKGNTAIANFGTDSASATPAPAAAGSSAANDSLATAAVLLARSSKWKGIAYRRMMIARCTKLSYLDDAAVDEFDRRTARAWLDAGSDGETREKLTISRELQQEEEQKARAWEQFKLQQQTATANAMVSSNGAAIGDTKSPPATATAAASIASPPSADAKRDVPSAGDADADAELEAGNELEVRLKRYREQKQREADAARVFWESERLRFDAEEKAIRDKAEAENRRRAAERKREADSAEADRLAAEREQKRKEESERAERESAAAERDRTDRFRAEREMRKQKTLSTQPKIKLTRTEQQRIKSTATASSTATTAADDESNRRLLEQGKFMADLASRLQASAAATPSVGSSVAAAAGVAGEADLFRKLLSTGSSSTASADASPVRAAAPAAAASPRVVELHTKEESDPPSARNGSTSASASAGSPAVAKLGIGIWNDERDELLVAISDESSFDWKLVGQEMTKRTNCHYSEKLCRLRYALLVSDKF